MIIGATVFAVLILMLLLAERGSGVLWQGAGEEALFYCADCDLRYPLGELPDPARRVCPRGHLAQPLPQGFPFSTFFICLCVVFIGAGAFVIFSGVGPGP